MADISKISVPISGTNAELNIKDSDARQSLNSKTNLTIIAAAFSSSQSYAIGDYVIYEGNFYKCTTAHSAGAWNSDHFAQVSVGEELNGRVIAGDPITVDPGSDSAAGVTLSNDNSGNSTYYKIDGINAADTGFAINSAGDMTLYAEDDVNITAYDGDASIIAASGFTVTLNDEDVIDADSTGNMKLFNSEAGGIVNVYGALKVRDTDSNNGVEIKTFAEDNSNGADILIKTDKITGATGDAGDIEITSLGGINMNSSDTTHISSNSDLKLSMTYGENDFIIESANDLQLQGHGNNVVCNLYSDGGANFAGAITSPTISAITDNLGSKNLLKVTAETQTVNGVTFTVNRNAQGECTSITANGTSTSAWNARIELGRFILPKGIYHITSGSTPSDSSMLVGLRKASDGSSIVTSYQRVDTFVLNADTEVYMTLGDIGVAISSKTVYPMICPIRTDAMTFVPYAPTNREIGSAMSVDTSRNATFAANIVAQGTVTANGSDYAENFPALETCPVCRFVTLDGEGIRLADGGDYILGVTSEAPSMIGDKNVDGVPVGLLGKLWVEHDGTAKVNGFVVCGRDGIATASDSGYRVMAVNGGKCRILVK